MSKPYRVVVQAHIVVTAKSNSDAKAKAELAVRQAVADSYRSEGVAYWGDGWEAFAFQARKAERYESGTTDESE